MLIARSTDLEGTLGGATGPRAPHLLVLVFTRSLLPSPTYLLHRTDDPKPKRDERVGRTHMGPLLVVRAGKRNIGHIESQKLIRAHQQRQHGA